MSKKSRIFVTAKNKKYHIRRGTAVTEHIRLMTKNEQFYAEQVINYLNLLHGSDVFSYEEYNINDGGNGKELRIKCEKTAYINELYHLVNLINALTICIDTRDTSVTIR